MGRDVVGNDDNNFKEMLQVCSMSQKHALIWVCHFLSPILPLKKENLSLEVPKLTFSKRLLWETGIRTAAPRVRYQLFDHYMLFVDRGLCRGRGWIRMVAPALEQRA